jgi:hypothetical protein
MLEPTLTGYYSLVPITVDIQRRGLGKEELRRSLRQGSYGSTGSGSAVEQTSRSIVARMSEAGSTLVSAQAEMAEARQGFWCGSAWLQAPRTAREGLQLHMYKLLSQGFA